MAVVVGGDSDRPIRNHFFFVLYPTTTQSGNKEYNSGFNLYFQKYNNITLAHIIIS